jgi:ubiquinone/menaquinone biosynthesis C-methylase UbiE
LRGGIDDYGGSPEETMKAYVLHFEGAIVKAVEHFAAAVEPGQRVLDAGAGEGQYAGHFTGHRYVGVDLGVGDANWDYRRLDALADLRALPFPDGVFAGALNVVTLEHVTDPQAVWRNWRGCWPRADGCC